MNDRATLPERYGRAVRTSDLSLDLERRTDADYLLAAGFAAAGNVRGQMALTLYRAMQGPVWGASMRELQAWAAADLRRTNSPKARKMAAETANTLARSVIDWWVNGICPSCTGRRYELIPGTQVTGDQLCHACNGRGKTRLENRVERKHQEAALRLASIFDAMVSDVLGRMARSLSQRMDF